jgi:signal transduction histidine kinase/ActR/RegA family two-component response regulator
VTERAVTAASMKRRLDVGCALAEALLDRSANEPRPELRREAMELLEQFELPTAVFDVASRSPRLLSAAWQALFGTCGAYDVIAGIDEVALGGATHHVAELAIELDGRPAFCAATLRPSCGLDTATRVIVVCADITDDVIACELAVTADALVWSGPLARDADYYNRRWLEYAGRPNGQTTIHAGDGASCSSALAESGEVEARLRRADGEYRWHRIRFTRPSSGARWFGAAIDVDEAHRLDAERNELLSRERLARADAEQANRLKDQFLAAVSHELRAPLTTMLLWEKVLREESTKPELRAQALEAIRQSALSQSRVVGDLLDISRAISGKLYVDLRPVEIERVVRGAFEAIVPQALAKQIAIDRGGTLVGEVLGDTVRLRQVLDNLMTNAVKFTDPGGRIRVNVSRKGRSIVIAVEDTGRGIEPEFMPHLFEPFSQTDDSLTRRDAGLGLGLAIAKQLVDLHHGSLVASSSGKGLGATFTVTLPIARKQVKTPVHGAARPHKLDGVRVLVVDDDRRVRDALAVLLGHVGAVVETADSAEAARSRIAGQVPAAIVCDIAMPVEDGYSFIRRLRAAGLDVVAIALTAYATEGDAQRALAAGFDRHLAKPIEFERLVANIHELLAKRHTRDH